MASGSCTACTPSAVSTPSSGPRTNLDLQLASDYQGVILDRRQRRTTQLPAFETGDRARGRAQAGRDILLRQSLSHALRYQPVEQHS
jgi:hypothetical protein